MEHTFPTRKGLIIGGILVALHGRRSELRIQATRLNIDWKDHSEIAEFNKAIEEVQQGHEFQTKHGELLDLMSHTRQTIRISYDEWDEVCPIKEKME